MKAVEKEIIEIDPSKVKVFISRKRGSARFDLIKQSIAERGQKIPGMVRDIRHWPKEERTRPEGGLYDWGLIVGEGRLTIAKELGRKFRATVEDQPEVAVYGDFLAENLARTSLPWWDMAHIVKIDLDSGMSMEDAAKEYSISIGHVRKLHRTISKTAQGLEDDVAEMSMNEAEVFTAMPAEHQSIVIDAFHETGQKDLKAVMRKAQKLTEEQGSLSVTSLKAAIQQTGDELQRLREVLKMRRLHHALGPANLEVLLRDKRIRDGLIRAGVNLTKFEESK